MKIEDLKSLFTKSKDSNLELRKSANDKRSIIARAIANSMYMDEREVYSYLSDYDDDYIYFEIYDYKAEQYTYWRLGYSFNGTSVTLSAENAVEVTPLTQWTEVKYEDEDLDKSLTAKFNTWLSKNFTETKGNLPILKELDEDEMIAIEPLYIAYGDVDGVGDAYYDENTVHDMVKSFNEANNKGILKSSYFHKVITEDFSIMKAWVNECECIIGDTVVPEGQPLVKTQFINEKAWEKRKSQGLLGVSIGARASEVIEVDE